MPVGFTKEDQDPIIESHHGGLEEVFCLRLLPQIQSFHYLVPRDQIGDRLKAFKDNRILLYIRDRDLRPVTLETLALDTFRLRHYL